MPKQKSTADIAEDMIKQAANEKPQKQTSPLSYAMAGKANLNHKKKTRKPKMPDTSC